MSLKALPHDVRSMLCASAQINNYKTAIEELIYNSLDAGSNSIAIRVNLPENRLQVIDNGCGIIKNDFDVLGHRHMTSKLTDINTLKSTPKYYGYRGEVLANIMEISQRVKITSRHKDGEETWALTSYEGKKSSLVKITTRPSKGTTIEIYGFLYNLNIQKRRINTINELQNIKSCLEQLSIVHNDISVSLRDDSKNEIIFKIHKKRNIYQTLFTLFDIKESEVQELQVEKKEYKVRAFIGNTDTIISKQWIYVNGRFLHSTNKLQTLIDGYLMKYTPKTSLKKVKYDVLHKEEHLFQMNCPFYFILITCPYLNYDINFGTCQSIIEFKNWGQVKKLIEKLVKFYVDDDSLKNLIEIKNTEKRTNDAHVANTIKDKGTVQEVSKIIDRILGNNAKKIGTSQLQNGIKGKLIKRKKKSKDKELRCHNKTSKIDKKTNQHADITNANVPVRSSGNIASKINRKEISLKKKDDTKSKQTKHYKIDIENLHKNKPNKIKAKSKKFTKTSKIQKKRLKTISKIINTSIINPALTVTSTKNNHCKKVQNVLDKCKDNDGPQATFLDEGESMDGNHNSAEFLQDHVANAYSNNKPRFTRFRMPLSQEIKKYAINYLKYNMKINPFKTTYDLVHTILDSPLEVSYYIDDRRTGIKVVENYVSNDKQSSIRLPIYLPQTNTFSRYVSHDHNRNYAMSWNYISKSIPRHRVSCRLSSENVSTIDTNGQYNYNNASIESVSDSLKCADIFDHGAYDFLTQHQSTYNPSIPIVSPLTYDSHQYNNYYQKISDNRPQTKGQTSRFITKLSKNNFITCGCKRETYKSKFKNIRKKTINKHPNYNDEYFKQITNESYKIEFTSSNKMHTLTKEKELLTSMHAEDLMSNVDGKTHCKSNTCEPTYDFTMSVGKTYTTIPSCTNLSSNSLKSIHQNNTQNAKYTVSHNVYVTSSVHCSNKENNNNLITNEKPEDKYSEVVFASRSEKFDYDENNDDHIQPVNLCETVLNDNGTNEKEFAFSFKRNNEQYDSLYNNANANDEQIERSQLQINHFQDITVSHHFSNKLVTNPVTPMRSTSKCKIDSPQPINTINVGEKLNKITENDQTDLKELMADVNENIDGADCIANHNNFNFKDRLRFLPKGMSQIFEKSGSKALCEYNLSEDYYEDIIYNDFIEEVHMQTEIYEPEVRNVANFSTKEIQKFKNKVQKDNTDLIFNEQSLKEVQVLDQVDCKFVTTTMKGTHRGSDIVSEYLILFDQHAVHERVRLETNLASYFSDNRWKSVPVNNVTLKLSQDEILYLHNYKDKFNQLGLQWTILESDEVLINSIPEAILGKNPREVDKVMKAVMNLIVEEINVIQLQKGCIALYPKSIMDLVFSEACRYAIKFGDKLSKRDCIDLLHDLSNCKTPFQCAHGRPVMAVIFEIKNDMHEYKVNMASIEKIILKRKKEYIGF